MSPVVHVDRVEINAGENGGVSGLRGGCARQRGKRGDGRLTDLKADVRVGTDDVVEEFNLAPALGKRVPRLCQCSQSHGTEEDRRSRPLFLLFAWRGKRKSGNEHRAARPPLPAACVVERCRAVCGEARCPDEKATAAEGWTREEEREEGKNVDRSPCFSFAILGRSAISRLHPRDT